MELKHYMLCYKEMTKRLQTLFQEFATLFNLLRYYIFLAHGQHPHEADSLALQEN